MSFLPHTGGIVYNPQSPASAPTAQTSGFAQAGDAPPSEQVGTTSNSSSGGGGGLATSSLVPKPGTTIDPATGKPHTAGLTRAELEAKRAAEAVAGEGQGGAAAAELQGGLQSSPLVPKPGTSIDPATGKPHTAGLTRAELQAKRAAEAAAAATGSSPSSQPASSAEIPPNQHGTSGVSNEELEQIKNKGADLLDPTPLALQARRSSHSQSQSGFAPDGRRLSDLTGREQAARQLAGTAVPPNVGTAPGAGEITPGLELPGAWGPAKTVPFPGTAPNAPTSIYEDVAEGLGKVGQAAFAAIPSPIKEAFSTQPTSPTQSTSPKAPSSPRFNVAASPPIGTSPPEARRTSGEARRSSVTALFDQAKLQATKVASDVTGTLQNTQRDLGTSLGKDSEIFKNVKGFVSEAFSNPGPTQSTGIGMGFYPTGPGRAHPIGITPRFSLPSEEPAGAQPGEHTSGVGALPGTAAETGVAILPEEKKPAATLPSQENQGVRPGESSGGVGALPGKLGESDVALLPDERASKAYNELPPATSGSGSAGPSGSGLASDAIPTTGTATSRHVGDNSLPSSSNAAPSGSSTSGSGSGFGSGSYTGLAAPLPATFLGQGADKGATDVLATLGSSAATTRDESAIPSIIGTAPSTVEGSAASSTFSPDFSAAETRHGNERTTSSASVTAIRHGHEGSVSKSSPLAGEGVTVPEHEELHASSPTGAAIPALSSTTPRTGSAQTTSLTPGNEHEGIGHPSTLTIEGATREPGSYPAADHSTADRATSSAVPATGTADGAGVDAAASSPATTIQPENLDAEKSKADALVDAPAQTDDVTAVAPAHAPATVDKSSSATTPSTTSNIDNSTRNAVSTEPPANGPTQIPVDKEVSSTPTSSASPASASASKPTPTTSTTGTGVSPTTTPASPKVTTNGAGNGNGSASPISKIPQAQTQGHSRNTSTGSGNEKRKSGIFGKIKEKLKH
ncbi:hypothetical protein I316_06092 [Kwoniella heveanensis BCC8398]|uniref:Uncharacterized protein n=1 Tax=Kwoniella heveanensis BCC8398 TaxID=1296120 RepID=A0A1B9GME8_9TREE|nr:hypothetical protein I316_06092 [Kwoniella heveanensis BCC8398]